MYTTRVREARGVSQVKKIDSCCYLQKQKGYYMSTALLDESYKNRQDIEKRFKVSRATIYRWIKAGKFPKPVHLGANMVRWKASDIQEWIAERDVS